MDCTKARQLLHGYIDQELDLANVMAIEEHLASCAGCEQMYSRQTALKSAIRQHAQYHRAPDELARRIRAHIARSEEVPSRKVHKPQRDWKGIGRWFQLGGAIAATAVVTWTATMQVSAPDLIAEEVISNHARAVITNHLTDVATSDRHTVKPWLSSKLDFSPRVTDLTDSGFPLAGGRLDYLDNRPVAALVFHRRQHVINLFVWPDAKAAAASPQQTRSKHGYNLVHWADSGMTYWAISDLDAKELKEFALQYTSAK